MKALLFKILQPGVTWMGLCRMPAKFALAGGIVVLPLLWLLWTAAGGTIDALQTVQRQRAGFAMVDCVVETVAALQMHRGWSNRLLNGDAQAGSALDAAGLRLREQASRLDALAEAHEHTLGSIAAGWKRLRPAISALSARPSIGADLNALWQAHTDEIEDLRQLLAALGSEAALVDAGSARTGLLAEFTVERAVPWMESIGQLRGLGAGLLVRRVVTISEQAHMLLMAEALDDEVQQFASQRSAWKKAGIDTPLGWAPASAATRRFAQAARTAFASDHVDADPGAFFYAGTEALSAVLRLAQDVDAIGRNNLDRNVRQIVGNAVMSVAVVALCALLLGYVAACFQFSFMTRLRTLEQALDAVITGNLGVSVDLKGHDELAALGARVEQVIARLSTLVSAMRNSAVRVGEASAEVASGGLALSQRTEAEAVSLRQSVVAVQGLSVAVASNARAASNLEALTNTLSTQARAGGAAMRDACEAMGSLEQSALRVAEVNNVIDDVAFQTNMLAINAAVEAARAGESGKGFAVVAGEVRALAHRCSQAASEIRELIDQTNGRVDLTRETMGEASRTIDGLVGGVAEVSLRLKDIASSSAVQSRGLEEVTAQVGHLDMLTLGNAQMVERAQSSSSMLTAQAESLRHSVATIQLRQGSVDEARALVERAAEHLRDAGWDAAAKAFNAGQVTWTDRDLFLFAVDLKGRYLIHGNDASMIGKPLFGLDDDAAAAFIAQARQSLVEGNGWLTYGARSPTSNRVVAKTSFLQQIGDDVTLGCGVHREDVACDDSALGSLLV